MVRFKDVKTPEILGLIENAYRDGIKATSVLKDLIKNAYQDGIQAALAVKDVQDPVQQDDAPPISEQVRRELGR